MWFQLCAHPACAPAGEATSGGSNAAPRRSRALTIDLHCHVFTPAVERLVAGTSQKAAETKLMLDTMGPESVDHNNQVMLPKAGPKLTRVEQRLTDMDAMGVDVQVISPSPNQYYYWAERELSAEIVQVQNEEIAELCARHPTRLAGLGNVSLQHPELACEQIEQAVRRQGLKGIEISTSANGRELSDPTLHQIWRKCEDVGALVFIHPFGTTLGARTNAHYLVNTIGQPLETTIALSHLMFGGVLDAHPGLKIVAAHGGGYLPTYIGRSDHAWNVRPEAATQCATQPSQHLKRVWFDSVVYEPLALRHLVDRVGASQVVIGTDYPFDMGHYDVHGLVERTPGLTEAERLAILGGNAARLIGWTVPSAS
jgi:aminocarboxymuconate-semialdehyde decarboxylase